MTGTIELERIPSKHYTLTLIIKDSIYQGRGEADTKIPLEHGYRFEGTFRLHIPPGWDELIGASGVQFRWGPEAEPGDGLEIQIHMGSVRVMTVASHVATSNTGLIRSGGAIQWYGYPNDPKDLAYSSQLFNHSFEGHAFGPLNLSNALQAGRLR